MSQYVDSDYYYNVYRGNNDYEEIDKYLKMASEKIDEVTFNRIVKIGFDKLTDFQKEKVKEAVCAQTDYICENGYDNEEGDISSYSVLDITVNEKNNSESEAQKCGMSSYAYSQIKKTGLTCRSFRL